jgi:hypothetical protein
MKAVFFPYRNGLTSELGIGCKTSLRQVLIRAQTRNAKNFVANGCGENRRTEGRERDHIL